MEGDDEAISNLKMVERLVAVALWCLQEDPDYQTYNAEGDTNA